MRPEELKQIEKIKWRGKLGDTTVEWMLRIYDQIGKSGVMEFYLKDDTGNFHVTLYCDFILIENEDRSYSLKAYDDHPRKDLINQLRLRLWYVSLDQVIIEYLNLGKVELKSV